MSYKLFLYGNLQNNFGTHKAPRHTSHIWTSLFASRPSQNTADIAFSCYCARPVLIATCVVFRCC